MSIERFKKAHMRDFDDALAEIQNERKKSHWMWYIFPQIEGLGFSETAQYYAVQDLEEAREIMADDYLRGNILKITKALLSLSNNNPIEVMGYPDNLKLCSSMTLFEAAAPEHCEFGQVIEKFFDGKRDGMTLSILRENK